MEDNAREIPRLFKCFNSMWYYCNYRIDKYWYNILKRLLVDEELNLDFLVDITRGGDEIDLSKFNLEGAEDE